MTELFDTRPGARATLPSMKGLVLTLLLAAGCSGDIVAAAESVPVSPSQLCRWEVLRYWTTPPGEMGVVWVTGSASLALYPEEDFCPSFRCLFVPTDGTVVILRDPWSDGGEVFTRSGATRDDLPAECPEESKASAGGEG